MKKYAILAASVLFATLLSRVHMAMGSSLTEPSLVSSCPVFALITKCCPSAETSEGEDAHRRVPVFGLNL
jgi:hypothetical protein